MLNKNKRNCSTPNFYTMFKQNTGKVSKYRSNITLAKKTYLGVPSNLEKKNPFKEHHGKQQEAIQSPSHNHRDKNHNMSAGSSNHGPVYSQLDRIHQTADKCL